MTATSPLPSISIVTAVFNRADTIGDAIESVRGQSRAPLEHIVIDGGSSDGTLDVLARYPGLVVESGRDRGVYDAWNKGVARARGDLVLFVNSDDLLAEGALEAIAQAAAAAPEADVISGGAVVTDLAGRTMYDYSGSAARALSYELIMLRPGIINARALRRRLLAKVGAFDLSYRLAADHDFMIRCLNAGARSVDLDRLVCIYRQHGTSLTYDPTGRHVGAMSEEFLRLAGRWMSEPGAPTALKRACRLRYGRSAVTLTRLAIAGRSGGRLGALLADHKGRASLAPVVYAAGAVWAWLRDAPYARSR